MSGELAAATAAYHSVQLSAVLHARAQACIAPAIQYLLSRQSPGGGFCFYRWQGIEEPSLADTWHAVAALALLGVEVPQREETRGYLQHFPGTGLDNLYFRTLALDRLGAAIETRAQAHIADLDAARYLDNENVPLGARLRRALQIVSLQRLVAGIRDAESIGQRILSLCREGGWGDKPNLVDTWFAVAILDVCGIHAVPDVTRSFVHDVQVASLGFTGTRGSLYATLDTVHAGIRVCTVLGFPLRHPDDAIGFVLSCRTGAGSFARSSDALPDVSLTHRGLLVLAAVNALPMSNLARLRLDSGY